MPLRNVYPFGMPRIPKNNRAAVHPEEIKRIPFKELKVLQIPNKVERKTEKSADTACLQEMAVMFACMKENDFKEAKCAKEIDIFNKCYKQHSAEKKLKKAREASGEITVGTSVRNITTKQLNQLLQKYPQFNEKPVKK